MKDELTELVPSLRKFAYSLTGNMHDADDLLQNTLERLLSKPLPEQVTLMAWAFRVCRNCWIDEYRAKKVRANACDVLSHEAQSVHQLNMDEAVTQAITLKQVSSAMDELPYEQRETLSLVAVQGMSYADASEVLQVPAGTIMSRLARARVKISNLLNGQKEVLS
ncbi:MULTISPECIES: sigma-70 family RNA polymerase sigma factor [unclassified Alteromonas]|uniref:RNA polymerase sigma factor n=1 Tax=unclassified Alteromonas TaxID=2614992 RepID=UPI001EF1B307|nr:MULTISPECIES: sigma-70 family RNA polymerase sigma factor [unclassified Alteromonas]MCG7635898.1 sigma-70 family RNA polymerase sigma factor [Alteromonas sp. CNT1-28]MCG7811263.1 sigma-70 family RNA polymerase sigma factor [Alteromonas sp. MCA-1]